MRYPHSDRGIYYCRVTRHAVSGVDRAWEIPVWSGSVVSRRRSLPSLWNDAAGVCVGQRTHDRGASQLHPGKSFLVPLLAVPLLAGACASVDKPRTAPPSAPDQAPPVVTDLLLRQALAGKWRMEPKM